LNLNDPKTVDALQARAAKLLSNIGPDAVLAPPAAVAVAVSTDPAAADQPTAAAIVAAAKNPPTSEAAS
jgi:hypothetical protein